MRQLRSFRFGLVSLFRGTTSADRRSRSRGGLLLSVVMLPILLGVMGCFELPAPIGDPERSRIEPGITGIWLEDGGELDGLMLIFEPYDRRTWLMRWIQLEDRDIDNLDGADQAAEGEAAEIIELDNGEEIVLDPVDDRSTLEKLLARRLQAEGVALFKVWRKRISGKSFFTMEFRGPLNVDTGMESGVWWGARLQLTDDDRLELSFIDNDFVEIEDEMTTRQLERVVRRHHDNPELYAGDTPILLTRIQQENYDVIAEMLDDMGLAATYD